MNRYNRKDDGENNAIEINNDAEICLDYNNIMDLEEKEKQLSCSLQNNNKYFSNNGSKWKYYFLLLILVYQNALIGKKTVIFFI